MSTLLFLARFVFPNFLYVSFDLLKFLNYWITCLSFSSKFLVCQIYTSLFKFELVLSFSFSHFAYSARSQNFSLHSKLLCSARSRDSFTRWLIFTLSTFHHFLFLALFFTYTREVAINMAISFVELCSTLCVGIFDLKIKPTLYVNASRF